MNETWTAPGMPKQLDYVEVKSERGVLIVTPYFKRVDRPQGVGIQLPANKLGLAYRLVDAMLDGAVFRSFTVNRDKAGKTYTHAPLTVLTRHLNAELNKIGF